MGKQLNSKKLRNAYTSQVEDLSHPASKRQPDAYTLEQETVERALQKVASSARVEQAKSAGVVSDPVKFESQLADALLDNPELPLRIAASRIPRPTLLPELKNDSSAIELPVIQQGPYKGWRVLAFHERQITPGDRYKKIPRKIVLVGGGAEVCAPAAAHKHPTPFGFGVALVWLKGLGAGGQMGLSAPFGGPMAGIEAGSVPEYYGLSVPRIILAPHLTLLRKLNLEAGPILNGLTLVDAQGYKAMVARHWRCELIQGEDFGPPFPLYEGTDLLIRPDLFQSLEKLFMPNVIRFCSNAEEELKEEPSAYV